MDFNSNQGEGMSNPITDSTLNVVMQLGRHGFASVAVMPMDNKTPSGKDRFKVVFARKPFSFGETIKGTLPKQVSCDPSEGMGSLLMKALKAYFDEHPYDFKPWYDDFRKAVKG